MLYSSAAFAALLGVVTVSSVWMQAEMSEDEGHSQGDADSDADDDGDLVSVHATCMQCKQQLWCIFIIHNIIAIGLNPSRQCLCSNGEDTLSCLNEFLFLGTEKWKNCRSVGLVASASL